MVFNEFFCYFRSKRAIRERSVIGKTFFVKRGVLEGD